MSFPRTDGRTRWAVGSVALGLFAVVSAVGCGAETNTAEEPSITITRPEPGAVVSESRMQVRGTATDLEAVTVNGKETEVVGDTWKVLLEFDQGSATITAKGGGARATREFTVDSHAPNLRVDTPSRATYVADDERPEVVVEGSVRDSGTGVRLVSVEGNAVEVASDGSFETTVELREGHNLVEIEAFDRADNSTDVLRGVVHGPLASPTSRIDPGFNVQVGPTGVETAVTVAEQFLTPQRLTTFARENVDNDNFALNRVDYDTLELGATLERGHIRIQVDVENLEIEGDAVIDTTTYPVIITIDEASWSGELHVDVDDSDSLVFAVENPALDLQKEDFHFALRDASGDKQDVDVDVLRRLAVDVARRALTGAIEGEVVGALWDPAVLKRRIELMGRTLVFEVVPREVRIRPRALEFRGALAMPEERSSSVARVPGALTRELGPWSPSELQSDAAVGTNRTAVERIAHGAWRVGLFHRSLGNRDLADYEVPVELNAESLAFAVDKRILQLAEGDTPAAIRLRPLLPPGVRFSTESSDAGDAVVRMHEFMVDLVLKPSEGTPIRIASVAVFFDLAADVSLDGFALNLSFSVDVRTDLHAEPEFDFEDAKLEKAVAGIMKAVPRLIGDEMRIAGESELRWMQLKNPTLSVEGERGDRARFSVDLAPNSSGLEP